MTKKTIKKIRAVLIAIAVAAIMIRLATPEPDSVPAGSDNAPVPAAGSR